MSTLIVEIVKIAEVNPHENADKLDIVRLSNKEGITWGWDVIVQKNSMKVGDEVIYVPVDAVLSEKLENHFFPADSKIHRDDSRRIKAIKIRKHLSVGLVLSLDDEIYTLYPELKKKKFGNDCADILEITKYEPPVRNIPRNMRGKIVKRNHPDFKKYVDIEHFHFYPDAFEQEEDVSITEKVHGSNWRGGWLESRTDTIWKKVLRLFKILPKYSFVLGSHNIQLDVNKKLYYDRNIYAIIEKKYDLKNKLKPGEVLYGEVYGPEVQSGYSYGLNTGELGFVAFDVIKDGKYVDYSDFVKFCEDRDIPRVPELFVGQLKNINLQELSTGKSLLGNQPIREGCVVKSMKEGFHPRLGRKIVRIINPDYLLLKDNTDFH